jgi:exosortase/archaeosortase family protein
LSLITTIKSFFTDTRYRHFRDVFWFAVITLSIHYAYRFWANGLGYAPVRPLMLDLQNALTSLVFHQSAWVNEHLLNLSFRVSGQTMTFANGSWIAINNSCAGDKQILQFMLLLLIYPGPWRRKLWYIPLGMVLIHLTNILRIVLLSLVSVNWPELWHSAHDTVLRAMFYVVILVLWVVWTEKVKDAKCKMQNAKSEI